MTSEIYGRCKDIPILDYSINFDLSLVEKLLSTSYDKSSLHKDFVDQIKSNRQFIEKGIKLTKLDEGNCPFCKQNLNENALKIIGLYNDYIEDSESKNNKTN